MGTRYLHVDKCGAAGVYMNRVIYFFIVNIKSDVIVSVLMTNQWCPRENAPSFMYLPVPSLPVDDRLIERHYEYWLSTNDFDDDNQIGFWLYNAYKKSLPKEYKYLADRIMNILWAFGPELYAVKLKETVIGILSVSAKDFNFEPYFSRQLGGEQI
jgi:hypothetical protein